MNYGFTDQGQPLEPDTRASGPHAEVGRVLLIGGSGMLGRAWRGLLESEGLAYDAPRRTGRNKLDLTDQKSLGKWLGKGFRCVVNCAAWTDVDGAEAEPGQAKLINGAAVGELTNRCGEAGALLVHYSTDYVFRGTSNRPFRVSDPTEPLNVYGQSKLIGERRVLASEFKHLLVRTSWLYAPWGKNFVRSIVAQASRVPSLQVVDDQIGRPTSCDHLARQTLALIRHQAKGAYHVSDGGQCTWFEFARKIVQHVAPGCLVEPCTSDAYPRPACRPSYSVLDLSQAERLLGPMSHWETNLADVLARLEPEPV